METTRRLRAKGEWLVASLTPDWIKPNHLTFSRLLVAPLTISLILADQHLIAFLVFALGAFSDFWDGALARARNQITHWGKVMDPVADKFLILGPLILAFLKHLGDWLFIGHLIAFILVELAVIGVNWGIFIRKRERASSNLAGKITTGLLVLFFVPLLFFGGSGLLMILILGIGVLLKFISLVGYVRKLRGPAPR